MQINNSNNTTSRGFQECCLSLAKQQSTLSDPLCFCHSSKVGHKMKLLNQGLGRMPDFQTQAVKGPLCPLQSFTGTADCRAETVSGLSLSVKSPLVLWKNPWRDFSPPVVLVRGGLAVCTPSQPDPGLSNFPFTQASFQAAPAYLCLQDFWFLKKFSYTEK